MPKDAWGMAVELLTRWQEQGERADMLLAGVPAELGRSGRGRCQHLFYGALRHLGRVSAVFEPMLKKGPRALVRSILLIAGFELIEGKDAGQAARIGHHAVEQTKHLASLQESRMVNAVVRKMAAELAAMKVPEPGAGSESLSAYYSHPRWLVERWMKDFGEEGARALLEWNQQAAPVYARWRGEDSPSEADMEVLEASNWDGFYKVRSGQWEGVEKMLRDGKIFLQDPATRLAVGLLGLRRGMSVLDACAAPGGKSVMIADILAGAGGGSVVSLDLPGARIEQLRENLSRVKPGVDVALVQGDLNDGRNLLREHGLGIAFDAVLVDVPCSNTGVMRHRVDVKWRLQEGDFAKHAKQQASLLSDAGWLVAPGGALVYSTCSIDPEENEKVVEAFLAKTKGRYELEGQIQAYPWIDGHDGASAFLLRKQE